MEVLTQGRAKPALPFAGVYRLLDFPLSNLRHSGVEDVWMLVGTETQGLLDSLAGGRPWDLDRSRGGLRVVPPPRPLEQRGADGDADMVFAHRHLIAAEEPDALLVMRADQIYRLDHADLLAQHRRSHAEATVVTTRVPVAQARHHTLLDVDEQGRVHGVDSAPERPAHGVVATGVVALDTAVALELLEDLAAAEPVLGDVSDRLLPALATRGRVQEYRLAGYWKDVGRPETYFEAHRDALISRARRRSTDLRLDDESWPILTRDVTRMPAFVEQGGRVVDSLVSPACQVAGRVERSVLGPGTVVQEGAIVRDSVLLHDVTVRSGARVHHAIVDEGATVGAEAIVGSARIAGELPTTEELVLIGARARIAAAARVAPGDRVDLGGRRRPSSS